MSGSYVLSDSKTRIRSRNDRAYKRCLKALSIIGAFLVIGIVTLLAASASKWDEKPSRAEPLLETDNVHKTSTTSRLEDGHRSTRGDKPTKNYNDLNDLPHSTDLKISTTYPGGIVPYYYSDDKVTSDDIVFVSATYSPDIKPTKSSIVDVRSSSEVTNSDKPFIVPTPSSWKSTTTVTSKESSPTLTNQKHTTQTNDQLEIETPNIISTAGKSQANVRHSTTMPTTPSEPFVNKNIFQRQMLERHEPPQVHCPSVCNTIACKKAAAQALLQIDYDIDPCDDFYSYACNGRANRHIPDQTIADRFRFQVTDYIKLASRTDPSLTEYRTFHGSCMAFKCDGKTDPVVKHFRPLLDTVANSVDNKPDRLANAIGKILLGGHLSSRVMPIIDIQYRILSHIKIPVVIPPNHEPLMQNAHLGDLYVTHCRKEAEMLGKDERNVQRIVTLYESCLRNHTMYIKLVDKAVRLFDIFGGLPEFEREQKIKKVLTTIEWEVLGPIGYLTQSEIVKEMTISEPVLMSWDQFRLTICPSLNWTIIINILELHIMATDNVAIYFLERIKKICNFYAEQDPSTIIDVLVSMLTHDWYVDFMMPTIMPDRESYCDKLSMELMPEVIADVFQKSIEPLVEFETYSSESKELFAQLTTTLTANIERVPWLDAAAKGDLILKLHQLQFRSEPAQNKDLQMAAVKYSETDFVENVLVAQRRNSNQLFELKAQTTLSTEIFVHNSTVHVPLPIITDHIQRSRWDASRQSYQQFATLGWRLAQAIIGIFSPKELKTALSDNEYLQGFLTIRFADPAILRFNTNAFDLELDPDDIAASTNSRFADDGTVRLAWDAYKTFNTITDDLPLYGLNGTVAQTYYLMVAQQFCSANKVTRGQLAVDFHEKLALNDHLRVNNMMMNSGLFADSFQCPVGAVMNPEFKSDQFPFIET